MSKKNTFYITSPIYYATAAPHLGHMYTTIICDVVARYHRMLGHEVLFLTGTDEHGAKIAKAAEMAGLDTKKFVDKNAELFRDLKKTLNLSWDNFIRTSDQTRHWPGAQKLWKKLEEAGDIYKTLTLDGNGNMVLNGFIGYEPKAILTINSNETTQAGNWQATKVFEVRDSGDVKLTMTEKTCASATTCKCDYAPFGGDTYILYGGAECASGYLKKNTFIDNQTWTATCSSGLPTIKIKCSKLSSI